METKRITITLPEDILSDIDILCAKHSMTQSTMIESMIKVYLSERRRIEIRDDLKKGYLEMAEINLSVAEDFFSSDQATQDAYEHYLMGCE